ncbi:hypothetical protein [Pseudonocardia endophytica]|uniref:DUF308 domain-containing protein n=1 Tax=Pseudonocardia endophytica TaxID=401976 RepID=A0A4R1HVN5_PSEEN|nr:hypothetical protein [Pseudonocardia endophytica]TCK25065.1 hypothetical protein EV378_0862 [Pseudonocardia endophytica]
MNREPDESCGDDASRSSDDEFDRIVAAWRDEGSVPDWPDVPPPAAAPDPPPVHRPGPAESEDDDHYHPPEPPPLPRPGPPAVVGAGLIILGIVLIAVPETLGLSSLYGLPLGLLGIAAGLTWLVMRMWPSHEADDPHDGDDDGAVL